jgi:hypothetical protein
VEVSDRSLIDRRNMADLTYVAVLLAFFSLAALFVGACDRIVGPDEPAPDVAANPTLIESNQ